MKPTSAWSLLLVGFVASAWAQDLNAILAELPACGLICLAASVGASGCAPSDSACFCANPEAREQTRICVQQSCDPIDVLTLANAAAEICQDPIRSRQNLLWGTLACSIVASLCVIVRLISRLLFEGGLKADDLLMSAVFCLELTTKTLGCLFLEHGIGKDIWTLKIDDIVIALRLFYINEVLYVPILNFCKMSVLLFYLRIFPGQQFRRLCHFMLAWLILCTVLFDLLLILQNLPVSYFWLGWTGNFGPHRSLSSTAVVYAVSSVGLLQDIIILLMPLPLVMKLRIDYKRKLQLLFMFSLGIFVCITSVIRLRHLISLRYTTNPTWDYVDALYWSVLEATLSMIVPCLPAIRSLLGHAIPSVFGHSTQHSKTSAGRSFSHTASGTGAKASTTSSSARIQSPTYPEDTYGGFMKKNYLPIDETSADMVDGLRRADVESGAAPAHVPRRGLSSSSIGLGNTVALKSMTSSGSEISLVKPERGAWLDSGDDTSEHKK